MVRILILLLGLTGLHSSAWAATFTTTVDKDQLSQEEHIVLTFSLSNSDIRLRAEGSNPNIDLSVLTGDFSLGRPKANNHYNIYQGRGRSTSEIKVNLFPRRTGQLTIPAFEVDGIKTPAITIDVKETAAAMAPEIFVLSGSLQKELWVGQQLVVYLDVFHRIALDKASLGDNIETEPTRIELLQHWKLEQDTRVEKYQGYDYEVERVAWAIFPGNSGPLSVHLPDVWVTTQTGRRQRLEHQALEFDVKPLPKDVPSDIIIGKPSLTQTLAPRHVKQHELNHWTVTLTAPVAVTSLPDHLPGVELPDSFNFYPDPARRIVSKDVSGIVDYADYTMAFIPTEAGTFATAPIRVPYFDPASASINLVEIPGQTIKVISAGLPQPVSNIASDKPAQEKSEPGYIFKLNIWQGTTFVLALLWLATLILWQRARRQPLPNKPPAASPAPAKQADRRHPLQQQLLKAMASNTLEEGLTRWLEANPEDTTVLNAVRNVQRLCYGNTALKQQEIQSQVNEAVAILKSAPNGQADTSLDPWRPEAFTMTGDLPNNN